MLDDGLISQFESKDYQHWQNKNIYTEYLINEIDAQLIILHLQPKPTKEIFKKKKINKKVRRQVFDRDANECSNCYDDKDLCLDHIMPESQGGTSKADNLQILCRSCNSSKGTKAMDEWLEVRNASN